MTPSLINNPLDLTDVPILSFEPGAGLLPIDLDEMYRANTFIQGATRAGKSWMLRFLVEQLFGRVQQMLFDTEGEYASLTEKFDYALFSQQTPVQAIPANAPLLMRRLLELGTSAILDVSDLSTTDQQEFVRLAAHELLHLTTNNPHRILLVFDEVQRLAPNSGQGDATSTQELRELANRGLKRGLFLLAASQRHSSVDTAVRGAMTNLLVGGTPPGLDMKSAGEKLGFNAKEQRALGALPRGEFFALGAMFDAPNTPRVVHRVRSGAVQTRHMDALEARQYAPPRASEAVEALYKQLGDLPAQAEAEAHSLEEAQSEIQRLRARLAAMERDPPRAAPERVEVVKEVRVEVPMRVEVPVVADDQLKKLRDVVQEIRALLGEPPPANDTFEPKSIITPKAAPNMPTEAPNLGTSPEHADAVGMSPQLQKTPVSDIDPAPIVKSDISAQSDKPTLTQNLTLPKGAVRILTALARCHRATSTPAQLGTLTKLTPSGGTWTSYIGILKAQGLISQQGGVFGITPAGLAVLGKEMPREPMTTAEVLALWEPALKTKEREMLRLLIDAHPKGLTQPQLADRLGLTQGAGTFGGYLGTLRQNGLVAMTKVGVFASPMLFPNKHAD